MDRRASATRFPSSDEGRLLRAALLTGPPALEAWRDFRAEHGGIDHLHGDAFALLPQLFCNLRQLIPLDPALGLMGGIYRRTWYANQILLHAAAQAVSSLQAVGVRAMLTGGGALAALHPSEVGARPIEAIDMRVASRDRRRALARLQALGWIRQPPGSATQRLRGWDRVHLLRGPMERLNLHLPTALTPEHVPVPWDEAVTATVRGVRTLVPSSADQLLLTCAPRRLEWTPGPLRWIPEATLIIRSAAGIDRDRLRQRAQRLGLGAELEEALAYLAAEFGLELAPHVSRAAAAGATSADAPSGRLDVSRVEDFRRLALDSALAELIPALAARGVRPLLLKGPAFASWLYSDPRERPYGDLDLLVAPDQYEAARRELGELGFERSSSGMRSGEGVEHHETWIRPGSLPVVIELHYTLRMLMVPPSRVWDRLSAGARAIEVAGASVEVPSEAASALIVGLHAAQHGRAEARPMRDLRNAVQRLDIRTWQAAASLAREFGAETAFAAGLRLEGVGRAVCEALALPDTAPPRHLRLRILTASRTALSIERVVTARGAGARLRLLANELVPSPAFMRAYSPLARQGRCGLILAYLWRPLRLARKLPSGVRAWSQAGSDGDQSTGGTNV